MCHTISALNCGIWRTPPNPFGTPKTCWGYISCGQVKYFSEISCPTPPNIPGLKKGDIDILSLWYRFPSLSPKLNLQGQLHTTFHCGILLTVALLEQDICCTLIPGIYLFLFLLPFRQTHSHYADYVPIPRQCTFKELLKYDSKVPMFDGYTPGIRKDSLSLHHMGVVTRLKLKTGESRPVISEDLRAGGWQDFRATTERRK